LNNKHFIIVTRDSSTRNSWQQRYGCQRSTRGSRSCKHRLRQRRLWYKQTSLRSISNTFRVHPLLWQFQWN